MSHCYHQTQIKTHLFFTLLLLVLLVPLSALAQDDDLLGSLDDDDSKETTYTFGTFKGTRIINTFSTDLQPKNELQFIIMHRFGNVRNGINTLFGLDDASVRIGFEYGLNDRWAIGVGRANLTYDLYSKYKLLRQSKGAINMPVSVVLHNNVAIRTGPFAVGNSEASFSDRLFYTHQVLISRKFNSKFSLQLTPTYTHNNVRELAQESFDTFHLGLAGRMAISNRMSILVDYYRMFDEDLRSVFNESMGVALEIETGGHVFHLIFTNSQGLNEKLFLTRTTDDFFNGDIHFGFNISRTFPLKKNK